MIHTSLTPLLERVSFLLGCYIKEARSRILELWSQLRSDERTPKVVFFPSRNPRIWCVGRYATILFLGIIKSKSRSRILFAATVIFRCHIAIYVYPYFLLSFSNPTVCLTFWCILVEYTYVSFRLLDLLPRVCRVCLSPSVRCSLSCLIII